jgi:hypothetical protein
MNNFIVESENFNGLFGIFEDDGETGYLYLYEPKGEGVIDDLQIYSNSTKAGVKEDDVTVIWSNDLKKCGVKIWGNLYGIIDVETGKKISAKLTDKKSSPITKTETLKDFI